jgi:hypothetical protein
MSLQHISDFTNDVRRANPAFNPRTSCLRPLLRELEKRRYAPRRNDYALHRIVAHVRKSDARRIAKYEDAIGRLFEVWGSPWAAYPSASLTFRGQPAQAPEKVGINRICFRGDDRDPATVFTTGFESRADGPGGGPSAMLYKGNLAKLTPAEASGVDDTGLEKVTRAGDIVSETAVCVSTDMDAAALFPLPAVDVDKGAYSPKGFNGGHVYMVWVETGVQTSHRQALDALAGLAALTETARRKGEAVAPDRVAHLMFTLYGRELAARTIPPHHVIAAMRIERLWKSMGTKTMSDGRTAGWADWTKGGSYVVKNVQFNDAVSDEVRARIPLSVMREFLKLDGTTRKLPVPADGYAPARPPMPARSV